METIASLNSDSLLILDEISQATEKIIANTVYMLGNGVGKSRATKNIELAKPKTWNILFISSGEESLKTMIEKNSPKVNAGLEVRLIDIPANTNSGMGIFEDIHGFDSSAEFLSNLNSIATNNYGYAGEAYLEYVAHRFEKIKSEISNYLNNYIKSHDEVKESSQLQRIAAVFGIMCYAGKIACEAGLMNIAADEIDKSIDVCFKDFLSNRGSTSNSEENQIVSHVRKIIEKNQFSKFIDINSNNSDRLYDIMGYYEANEKGIKTFYFTAGLFSELCKGFDPKQFKDALYNAGMLQKSSSNSYYFKKTLPGINQRVNVYKINFTNFDEE